MDNADTAVDIHTIESARLDAISTYANNAKEVNEHMMVEHTESDSCGNKVCEGRR